MKTHMHPLAALAVAVCAIAALATPAADAQAAAAAAPAFNPAYVVPNITASASGGRAARGSGGPGTRSFSLLALAVTGFNRLSRAPDPLRPPLAQTAPCRSRSLRPASSQVRGRAARRPGRAPAGRCAAARCLRA
jgi:hypothetical protein